MQLQEPLRAQERENYEYFLSIPNTDPKLFKRESVKGSQLIMPLFEYSGVRGLRRDALCEITDAAFGDRA
jgi:pyruvate-ferredoxin/flavodoxin oxidoreductase